MKYIILLPIAIWLFACNNGHRTPDKPISHTPAIDTTTHSASENEGDDEPLGIAEDAYVPPGFRLDTVHAVDSALQLDIAVIHAVTADKRYNDLVNSAVDTALQEFRKDLASGPLDAEPNPLLGEDGLNRFEAFPLNYYQDQRMVSVRYAVSVNTSGAAHPIRYFKTVSYDKESEQSIKVNDYFNIKSSSDSSLLIRLMDREFKELREHSSNDPWSFYGLSRIDFFITKDAVVFNFAHYALGQGPSLVGYKVNKQELISVINPRYR